MGKCKDLTFSKVVSELFGIYSEIVIVAKIEDKIKLIAPISDDIVVIAPYVDDIETVSNNIDSVKNAYRNAQIAKESSTIATNAKKLAIEKAQEALSSANTAHLSALFASVKEENIEKISVKIDNKKIEIFGKIDEHNRFIDLSKREIEAIKNVLLQKNLETKIARDEAIQNAVIARDAKETVEAKANFVESAAPIVREQANRAIKSANDSKKYRDESKALSIDFKKKSTVFLSEGRGYRDETKTMYEELKNVGGTYDIKKEIYTLRTGTIYETRGEL